jgi:putative DNA methylase
MTLPYRKKLIEVALPLLAINDASAYDKMPGIGPHPKGIHHWWARLPLPCARAILFASLVDDPASDPRWEGAAPEVHQQERERLFGVITTLLQKRIYEHPEAFEAADAEIANATGGTPPNFLDPFSGGGSLPLEAQRLGLKVTATDLNPIAVLITKATTELAMRFIDTPPVNPSVDDKLFRGGWGRAKGLATDVRYYADWIGAELKKRIGHMFPEAKAQGGTQKAPPRTPLAWVWTRTVASPDPACGGAQVPLLRSFKLSTKKGRAAYVEPVVDKASNTWRFVVKTDGGTPASGTVGRKGGRCIISGAPIPLEYIRSEGKAGRLGQRLVATICDSAGGRVYLSPSEEQEGVQTSMPPSLPDAELAYNPFALRPPLYGLNHYTDLFTPRQLWALTTLTDLVQEAGQRILKDAAAIKPGERGQGVWDTDTRAAYANAITTFLACAVDRCVDFNNAVTTWIPTNEKVRNLFNRQAIPMVWDFAEANILAKSVGGW